MSDTKFSVDYSKRVSKCKKCKTEIPKGDIRLAKLVPNFFGDSDGEMKQFYHIKCLFDTFKRARSTTKVIESADDIQEFESIKDSDKDLIIDCIKSRFLRLNIILEKQKVNKFILDSGKGTSPKKVAKKAEVAKAIAAKAEGSDIETEVESDESEEEKPKTKKERLQVQKVMLKI